MAKIDEMKEALSSLRTYFGVCIALMVAVGGGLVSSFRTNTIDVLFWIGAFVFVSLGLIALAMIHKIRKKTKEIGEL
ncbi:MAG: hypothetical protein ACOC08_06500 [Campylobacterales bacterium]